MAKDWQEKLENKVKEYLAGYTACHDFWHHERVKNWALKISKEVPCDKNVLVAAALLHDAGYKNHENNDDNHHEYSMEIAEKWLPEVGFPQEKIADVLAVIKMHDNLGEANMIDTDHIETKVLQDADKLDALGATGIARFAYYYGERGHAIYSEEPIPEDSDKLWIDHSLLDQLRRDGLKKWEKLHFDYSKRVSKKKHDFMVNFYNELKEELQSEESMT